MRSGTRSWRRGRRRILAGARAMERLCWLVVCLVLMARPGFAQDASDGYRLAGEKALRRTAEIVALGPRPPASPAHRRQQRMIRQILGKLGSEIEAETFTASTPLGDLPMVNLIAKFPPVPPRAASGRLVIVSGHYDTYSREGLHFVGANDGGSSTGFLLTMAELIAGRRHRDEIWIVFFDGEESIRRWTELDHTYGSRHQAARWQADGTSQRIKALINVDMIGDADLQLVYEQNSTPWLRDLIWTTGRRLGYQDVFASRSPIAIADDHIAFVRAGIPAVDLIDFNYGLFNRNWHSERDTMDKLSAASFAAMLHVVNEVISKLEHLP